MTVVVRTAGDAASLTSILRTAVASIDPQLPIGLVRPMDDLIGESIAPRRLNFVLVSAFAFVALVLTARRAVRRDGVVGGAADAGNRRADGARRDAPAGARR